MRALCSRPLRGPLVRLAAEGFSGPRAHHDPAATPVTFWSEAGSQYVNPPGAHATSPQAKPEQGALEQIPDARAIATDPNLSALSRNRRITNGYSQLARLLQRIIDPAMPPQGPSRINSCWYGFGAHASRQTGRLLLGAEIAMRLLAREDGDDPSDRDATTRDTQALGPPSRDIASRGVPETEGRRGRPGAQGGPHQLDAPLENHVAALETALDALAGRCRWARVAGALALTACVEPSVVSAVDLRALIDPRTLITVSQRLRRIEKTVRDGEPLVRVLGTLVDTLEEANREIFLRVGGMGQTYFELHRHGSRPGADGVIEAFATTIATETSRVRQLIVFALETRAPTELASQLLERHDPSLTPEELLVATFSLYETCALETSAKQRNALVARANVLAAFAEQRLIAQPIFAPGKILEGEVDRKAVLGALTPLIQLTLPGGTWRFAPYARTSLPPRDASPLTPRATEYNWARFEDRWPAIIAFFERGYEAPAALWPMPDQASTRLFTQDASPMV